MTTGAAAARDYADHVTPSLLAVAATLLALAGIREGETVVDVGCGTGLLTHPASAAAGPDGRVYGIDPDSHALALARSRRTSSVRWAISSPDRLPFAAGSVDKVVCGVMLHRFPDVLPVLAEWARVLTPVGRAAVGAWTSFPASAAEDAVTRALSDHGVDPASFERRVHLMRAGTAFDATGLPAMLGEAGLRVTHEAGGDVTVPFAGAAAFASWRLAFPRAAAALGDAPDRAALRESVVARVADLLGPGPVLVHSGIQYVTASPG